MISFWWKNNPKPKIGVSCRSFEDVKYYAAMPEFDILELKISGLAKRGLPIYSIKNDRYIPEMRNVEKIRDALKGKPYQVHMPYEGDYLLPGERELFHSREEDHEALIDRQRTIGSIFKLTDNKSICVWHPVSVKIGEQKIASLNKAYETANELYLKLDKCVYEEEWPVQITFENQAGPKKINKTLGYSAKHIWKLFGQTKRIGITIDTGHGNLAPKDFQFRMFMGSGLPVCSIHWHGNEGNFDPNSYDDDQHEFATPKNVCGYHKWLALFKRLGLPVILELKKDYARKEIQKYARRLKNELAA